MARQKRSRYGHVVKTLTQLDYEAYVVHRSWMEYAIKLAQRAGDAGEVPVGAVIVDVQGDLIAQAINSKEKEQDATAHAELLAIRRACKVKQNWNLGDCTLYVTLEPCAMCAGAIINSRLKLLVYGASEPKTGAIRTVINLPDSDCSNHRLRVIDGIHEATCRHQLQAWFSRQRRKPG